MFVCTCRQDLKDTFIDSGVMTAIREWISPLPDKSLPALRIRQELLGILQEVRTQFYRLSLLHCLPLNCPTFVSLLQYTVSLRCPNISMLSIAIFAFCISMVVCLSLSASQCESGDVETQWDWTCCHVPLQTPQRG